jgi:2-hydroxychromene-2-carboxylate isomerase
MPRLDFYVDFVSPFAYFAWRRIEALANEHHAIFQLQPVLLGALLAHWGSKGRAEIPPKREFTYKTCLRYAAKHGVPFEFPARHPFKSVTALRCALPEVAGNDSRRAIAALFSAGWERGVDLGNDAVIAAALTAAGLNGPELVAATRGDVARSALRSATEAAL